MREKLRDDMVFLSVFGCAVVIHCSQPSVVQRIREIYSPFLRTFAGTLPKLVYHIRVQPRRPSYVLWRVGGKRYRGDDVGHTLFLLEKDMTVELQLRRNDLFFLHASVLAYKGDAVVIAAASGTGKSTTAWALVHEGFDYVSDELAPIDLQNWTVWPYPRAVGLKTPPPVYRLPVDCLHTSNGYHVPAERLPAATCKRALPLKALFFLAYDPARATTSVEPIANSLAMAYLYSNALNALSHADMGLAACEAIVRKVSCYRLVTAKNLKGTSEAVKRIFEPGDSALG